MKKPARDKDEFRLREALPYEQQAPESHSIFDAVEDRANDSSGQIRRREKR